jgi:hypothetical protein
LFVLEFACPYKKQGTFPPGGISAVPSARS